ncbi:MAG TPA: hypothetical protein VFA20_13085 [Myxococcaceae bacterium]|nr:hypothetical protein [Myxococcaceae bacterium]
MNRALPLTLALLAGPCAEQQSVHVSPAASKALGSPDDACRTASAEIPAFPDGGAPSSQPDLSLAPGAALEAPRPAFQAHPLLPPAKPGASVSEALGCLSGDEHTLATGARWPPPASERPQEAVRVNPLSGGLIVTHELAHPCCLQAELSAAVVGTAVKVIESLSGSPCTCRCASRLRTAVGLAPGRYSVTVVVREPGAGERTAWSGEAALPGKEPAADPGRSAGSGGTRP